MEIFCSVYTASLLFFLPSMNWSVVKYKIICLAFTVAFDPTVCEMKKEIKNV